MPRDLARDRGGEGEQRAPESQRDQNDMLPHHLNPPWRTRHRRRPPPPRELLRLRSPRALDERSDRPLA